MNKFLFAVCGFGLGFIVGLACLALTGGSGDLTPPTPVKAAAIDTGPASTKPENDYKSWGSFSTIPKKIGPGTAFMSFLNHLRTEGVWNPTATYHELVNFGQENGGSAMLNISAHGDGAMTLLCVADLGSDGNLTGVTVIQYCVWVSDQNLALKNRDRHLLAVGEAAGLNDAELGRFNKILRIVPIQRRPIPEAEYIESVLAALPARKVSVFRTRLKQYDSQQLDDPPAVGFNLSDRFAVDLVFAAAALISDQKESPYYKPNSYCWSFNIHPIFTVSFTGDRGSWPRFSVQEVDGLKPAP